MKPELLESIETPAVLLDRYKLAANIEKMQDLANAHHVKLRPHIKTHKSIQIANLQIEQGAHGIATKPGFGIGYPALTYDQQENSLTIAKLSEEHGFIPREGIDLPLGSKIRIIPNHSCPVANLAHNYVVINDSDYEFWPVDAAGCVR